MRVLALMLVVAQGPGSTLEVQEASPAPDSTLGTSDHRSELTPQRLPTFTPSSLELPGANELFRKVALVEGRSSPCEHFATQAVCDDLSIVKPILSHEPLEQSDGGPPIVPHFTFVAVKPGFTTCSCGQPRNLQLVYEFTVGSLEDAVRPVVRKVVGAAFSRLYTQRRSLVP